MTTDQQDEQNGQDKKEGNTAFRHEDIWRAIDRLATLFAYSPSGLAKQAGLDPTTFNKSKRFSAEGKPRWPSTESLSKILAVTGADLSDFFSLIGEDIAQHNTSLPSSIPMIGFAQAGQDGYFDEDGYPEGDAWDDIHFPEFDPRGDQKAFALEVSGNSMEPLYRAGDILILSPKATIRKGDRLVVKTRDGEIMAKELERKTANAMLLHSLNPYHEPYEVHLNQIEWKARIVWVSQ